MNKVSRVEQEQRALKISLYGVVFFALLALSFAVYTQSDAILFDGIYSLISFATTLLTLKVAQLAERPDDEQFHFGYTTLEPTLNLFKSLIVIIACVYAAMGALNRLLAGGTDAAYGWAVVYGLAATVGCLLVALLMRRMGQDSRSDLVRVEAKSWLVDALFSGAVLAGFACAWALTLTGHGQLARYVDPLLLMALVIAVLPIPARVLLNSLREVIVMAPPAELVDAIGERLLASLNQVPSELVEYRVNKRGRNTYVLVHVVVAKDFAVESIEQLDAIRWACNRQMKAWNPEIVMDILFVRDRQLAY